MSAEQTRGPARHGQALLAAGYIGVAVIIVLALTAPLPGFLQAGLYLLVLSVVPGGALLVIINRTPSSWLVALIGAVVVSLAIVMTATILMAYLELWEPIVIVTGTAVLSAAAGAIELNRVTR